MKYFAVDGLRFAVKEPDDTTDDQLTYISDTMSGIVAVLKSGDKDAISEVIDVPSFAKFYLVNEFMKNMDFDMSSVYYYYKNGKLYAGPVWDFDKSSGNTSPDIGSSRATNSYKSDGIMQDQQTLYKYIGKKNWFVDAVKQVYEEHYDYFENISADGGVLDTWRAAYGELFDRNFTVWNVARKWTNYQYTPKATYEENFQYFKDWCLARHTWLGDYWELFAYEYVRGDADGNGTVEVIDVTLIQRALANLNTGDDDGHMALRAALVDNELSVIDATLIQRYLGNMSNPYEINTTMKKRLRS